MDVKKLQDELALFSAERDWDQFHSNKNLSMALSVEASELLEIFQWLSEDESERVCDDEKKYQALRDELADIFIYLLKLCSKTHINLEEATLNKIEKNKEKYPVAKAKGNSKKYNEL